MNLGHNDINYTKFISPLGSLRKIGMFRLIDFQTNKDDEIMAQA